MTIATSIYVDIHAFSNEIFKKKINTDYKTLDWRNGYRMSELLIATIDINNYLISSNETITYTIN